MYRVADQDDRNYITKTLTMCWVGSKKNEPRSMETLKQKVEELFTGSRPATIIINCDDDDPNFIKGFMVYHQVAPKKAIVHAIFVRPHFRRQGLATLFLAKLKRAGTESVCFTLDLADDGVFMPIVNSMFDNTVSIRHLWESDRFTKGV